MGKGVGPGRLGKFFWWDSGEGGKGYSGWKIVNDVGAGEKEQAGPGQHFNANQPKQS